MIHIRYIYIRYCIRTLVLYEGFLPNFKRPWCVGQPSGVTSQLFMGKKLKINDEPIER